MKCNQENWACDNNVARESKCKLESGICKQADLDFERMAADDYMPANYYLCAK